MVPGAVEGRPGASAIRESGDVGPRGGGPAAYGTSGRVPRVAQTANGDPPGGSGPGCATDTRRELRGTRRGNDHFLSPLASRPSPPEQSGAYPGLTGPPRRHCGTVEVWFMPGQ